MKIRELITAYRKADIDKFKERIAELELIKAKLMGNPVKETGGLREDTMKIRNTRKEIAILKTIARERGLRL